ncbi:IS1 family transposase [Enterobacter intestinihominis]
MVFRKGFEGNNVNLWQHMVGLVGNSLWVKKSVEVHDKVIGNNVNIKHYH